MQIKWELSESAPRLRKVGPWARPVAILRKGLCVTCRNGARSEADLTQCGALVLPPPFLFLWLLVQFFFNAPLFGPCAARENPVVYASTRDWSGLTVRCDTLWAWNGHSVVLLALLSVSGNTHAVFLLHASQRVQLRCSGYWDASGEFCLPSLPSPLLHRISIKKKKKVSVAARQSVHPSKRSPTLQSSSGLCVPQIENEQQSTVGEVSQPLKVMALASRLAGPDNAVPRCTKSPTIRQLAESKETKKKKKKKNGSLFLHVCLLVCLFYYGNPTGRGLITGNPSKP